MNKDLLNLPGPLADEQLSMIAQQIIDHSLLQYRKGKLKMEIDKTLQERNVDEFIRLTTELNSIS